MFSLKKEKKTTPQTNSTSFLHILFFGVTLNPYHLGFATDHLIEIALL